MPSILGIIMSIIITFGTIPFAISTAFSPSLAVDTSYPSFDKLYFRISKISGSSSTQSILIFDLSIVLRQFSKL